MATLPLATSVRNLNRVQQIARVLARHGFGHVVERLNLARYLPLGKLMHEAGARQMAEVTIGKRLAAVCAELGPTFVKLAQMFATRPDLLTDDIIREFKRLQDQVPPFDNDVARSLIEREIGGPIEEHFTEFGDEPFASGSIGQVYHAQTKDGDKVVVKVKRPDIDDVVRHDLDLLKWLSQAAQNWLPELTRYRPRQIIEEFEQLLDRELDFISEASATARFGEALVDDAHVRIPQVYWHLTSRRILTLGRIDGENIDHLLDGDNRNVDRGLLARRLVDLYLKQFFDLRMYHADPHPGNILIAPPARIGLIDFGQVGTITDELSGQLIVLITAMVYREAGLAVDVLSDMGALGDDENGPRLTQALQQLLDKYHGLPLKRLDPMVIWAEIAGIIRSHDVALPRETVMVLKTLTTIAGTAIRLDAELDIAGIINPKLKHLIISRLSPARLMRMGGLTLWHFASVARSAPRQLRAIMRQFSRGTWQINIRHENLERLTSELDRSSNRVAFSMVLAAVIIGSSVVVSTRAEFPILGIPIQWFGIAGYLFAGILGVGLVWAIIRSGRLS